MAQRLKFDISNKDIKLRETLEQDFLELEMYVISDDKPNRNYSHFTPKSMYTSIPTFYNKPVLGFFNIKKGDFEEHNSDLEYDEQTEDLYWSYEAVDAEVPLGLIRESDSIEVVQKDGKNWIKITCAIWVKYNREKVKKLLKDRKKKVSVEVQVNDGRYEDDGIFYIEDFTFDGVTILGTRRGSSTEKVEEGIEGAHLSVLEAMQTELFSKQKMALSFAYEERDNKVKIGDVETDNAIFIDKNFEEREGEGIVPNFVNIAEGYEFVEEKDNCAIFKKEEKLYSFSLEDVDCTKEIEFVEESLAEVIEEVFIEEETVETPAEVAETVEVEEPAVEVEIVEAPVEETFVEEKEEEKCEEEKCAENEEEPKEEKESVEEEEKCSEDEDDKNDDNDDKDEEPTEEKETAEFVAEEEEVVPEVEVNEEVEELKAQNETFAARIAELEEENKELKNQIFAAECEKMVEYAKQLMSKKDFSEDEEKEIVDNCNKGIYTDTVSLEKDIAYVLFKREVEDETVVVDKSKNFSATIINENKKTEKDGNVFSRLKNI